MKKILLSIFGFLTISGIASADNKTFSFGTKTNPQNETVEVDSRGFIINGKRQVPVMGEMHYARVPEKHWRREIRKMKAGGVTILSTYCFWIHHEENEGVWNWSGNRNLHAFLRICKEEQMPVVLRVGPFCHGEVYQGGFPVWLVKKAIEAPKEYKIRSMAPGFIKATKRLYQNIYTQAKDMLWKNGGTVIGLQLENECRGPWTYYMTLKHIAVEAGFDLPFYTRTGWPKLNDKETFGEMLPLYGDYADGFWDRTLDDMPGEYASAFTMKDTRLSSVIATEALGSNQSTKMEQKDLAYPYLTCELGGGMMPSYHRRINISGNEALPLAICKLGSGSNLPGYYMYHGGTNPYNPAHTMAETQASDVTNYNDMPVMSYDFQCPLGEMGQPNLNSFHQTRLLHQFLADWGTELSKMDVDTLSKHYARRGCFEFYNDYVRIHNEEGSAWVRPVDMPWRGAKVTANAQLFCHVGDTLFFIPIKGMKPEVKIKGKKTPWRLLASDEARRVFKIKGTLHYARHDGGILYTVSDGRVMEEYWQTDRDITAIARMIARAAEPRKVEMGRQKVASMPTDEDFDKAQIYHIDIQKLVENGEVDASNADMVYLEIKYAADCARVYAGGKLVADNFWNGKPMLVRLSDLLAKDVELRILPLSKDAPIYLQKEQRRELEEAPAEGLLELKSISLVRCIVEPLYKSRSVNLSGRWDFAVAKNNDGNKIDNVSRKYDDTIVLPASMPQRLKGNDISVDTKWVGAIYDSSYYHNPWMEQYRLPGKDMKIPFFLTPDKHFVGKAWYRRSVTLHEGDLNNYSLYLERPHIASEVWVNGVNVGKRISLSVPHVFPLSDLLHSGVNTIEICVDNDPLVANVGQDSHSVTDQTQGNWNGIVGEISLRPYCAISNVKIYPDIDKKIARIVVNLDQLIEGQTGTISVEAESFNTAKTHNVALTLPKQKFGKLIVLHLNMGDDMLLWDEFNPQLYHLTVNVKTKKGEWQTRETFGMRKVEVRGKTIYINNRPVQLRGTVESCCFPLTGYPPTDIDSWRHEFEKCKEWGLNHIRFHSYCPPKAAFEAADLAGIYIQPEGPSWPNHGVRLGRGEQIDTYLLDESYSICDVYGNHPSFCFFAFGNEPAGDWVRWCSEKMPLMQQYDPRHLYAGFSVGGGWAWQPKTEFAVKAGARGLDTWNKAQPEAVSDFSEKISTYNGKDMPGTPITIPFVSHETGQWCVFPNFAEREKYIGVNKAKNFDIFYDLLKANGMECRSRDFMMASGKLQALCYKYELERHMRTPDYAGFQLLALNDYSGQGSAIVGLTDVFFDDKGYITAPEFREFCSPVVPLAGIKKFTYVPSENFHADINLTNYGVKSLSGILPQWEIRCSETGHVLSSGSLPAISEECQGLMKLGTVDIPLAEIVKAGKYTLSVRLPGTEARNHWDFWVYPQTDISEEGIYICDSLDNKAMKVLDKGGKVLLLAAGKVSYGREVKQQFTPVFWNTSWFKMRPPHTTGIFVKNQHPVFSDFPTDYHSDLQWWELVNKAQVMQFTDFPADFQPLVQSIDTWFVSRKIGMLFEANVGKGRLIMTTMDLKSDLDNRHAARQMRQSIINYMRSDSFQPKWTIAPSLISDLFSKVAGEVNMFTNDSPDELKPKLK